MDTNGEFLEIEPQEPFAGYRPQHLIDGEVRGIEEKRWQKAVELEGQGYSYKEACAIAADDYPLPGEI